MKDGPTAQWPPAGLGTEVTFPPDTLGEAERGLWVPGRGKHARLAIGMLSDACQGIKAVWQCTERTESAQKCKREEGKSMRNRVGEGRGRGLQARPGAESGAAVAPFHLMARPARKP